MRIGFTLDPPVFARGLSFSVDYTYSKMLNFVDELSDNMQAFGALPTRTTLHQWKGPAGWDVPHRLLINHIWEIPFKTSSIVDSASKFGKISSTRNSGRNIQFGMKVHF